MLRSRYHVFQGNPRQLVRFQVANNCLYQVLIAGKFVITDDDLGTFSLKKVNLKVTNVCKKSKKVIRSFVKIKLKVYSYTEYTKRPCKLKIPFKVTYKERWSFETFEGVVLEWTRGYSTDCHVPDEAEPEVVAVDLVVVVLVIATVAGSICLTSWRPRRRSRSSTGPIGIRPWGRSLGTNGNYILFYFDLIWFNSSQFVLFYLFF